jgi:hypothetical protein
LTPILEPILQAAATGGAPTALSDEALSVLLCAFKGRAVLAVTGICGTARRAAGYNSMDAGRWIWLWLWQRH